MAELSETGYRGEWTNERWHEERCPPAAGTEPVPPPHYPAKVRPGGGVLRAKILLIKTYSRASPQSVTQSRLVARLPRAHFGLAGWFGASRCRRGHLRRVVISHPRRSGKAHPSKSSRDVFQSGSVRVEF